MVHSSNKVVFVTGCSKGGLGYAMCEAFAKSGCTVYATARHLDRMAGLDTLGCHLLQLDVIDEAAVQQTISKVVDEQGKIDVLVNNAGTSWHMLASILVKDA